MTLTKRLTRNVSLLTAALLVGLVIVEGGLRWYYYSNHGPFRFAVTHALSRLVEILELPAVSGIALNKEAWKSTYSERGQQIPPSGPREGYWGSRIEPKDDSDPLLGIRERRQHIDSLVEVDSAGFQFVGERDYPNPHLVIIGASVAFGAYASSMSNTYFSLICRRLQADYPRIGISVFGRGAAMSEDDLAGLVLMKDIDAVHLVLIINGLNDLVMSKEQDVALRVKKYLRTMELARRFARRAHVPIVFAAQPYLGSKVRKTALERKILLLSAEDYEAMYNDQYRLLCEGLDRMCVGDSLAYAIDCSGIFDREAATTFADQWHFSDPGHRILADVLAPRLAAILARRPTPQ